MSAADPIEGLIALLKADTAVTSLVAARVFGMELPRAEVDSMPRNCLVVKPVSPSGVFGQAYNLWGDITVDIRAYGVTPYQARQVSLAAGQALKHTRRGVHAGCLIHWARGAGGTPPMRDPDTHWSFLATSWQVLISEQVVA